VSIVRPSPVPAKPDNPAPDGPPIAAAARPYQWLMPPRGGWGLLQIGETVYAVHECHFDDPDGRTCFCVRLRRQAGLIEYRLCLNRDNELACDCPDATYRDRECKHVHAVRDGYAQLDRERRLADFLAPNADADRVLDESARTGEACGIVRPHAAGERVPCPECDGRGDRYCRTCDGIGAVPAKRGAA
jgi:hypothetical protein